MIFLSAKTTRNTVMSRILDHPVKVAHPFPSTKASQSDRNRKKRLMGAHISFKCGSVWQSIANSTAGESRVVDSEAEVGEEAVV